MNGTEKQIEFAENLMSQLKNGIKKEVDYANDRSNRGTMPANYAEIYETEKNNFFAKLDQLSDAGKIISELKGNVQTFIKSFCQIADDKYANNK
jgi:hypothetical protein